MILDQSDIEEIQTAKAKRRLPRLREALDKTKINLATKDQFIADATARAKAKVADWEFLAAQYAEHIAIIEGGSYPGYNGKPFGATPGILKGIQF